MSYKEPHAQLGKSGEDYLEAILILSHELPVVRSVDIAKFLGFSKPSVSIAMKKLLEDRYIQKSQEDYITLTENGQAIAEEIYARHCFFREHLIEIGIDSRTAESDACRIEHDISEETFQKLLEANQKKSKSENEGREASS